MIFEKHHFLVADQAGEPLALGGGVGESLVMVVVSDAAVEERRVLARRNQAVVFEHVERQRPVLMRMQYHAAAADAVDRRVNALRGEFDDTVAFEGLAALVENDHVAGARLGPVQAERQDQKTIVVAGQGDREMVVDTFLELVHDREPERRGEVDPGLGYRVGAGVNRVNGHAGSP